MENRGLQIISNRQLTCNPQDFLEGSKPYNELMEKAREFYINSVGVDGPVKQPVILRLMQSVFADVEKFKKEEAHLPADDGKLIQ